MEEVCGKVLIAVVTGIAGGGRVVGYHTIKADIKLMRVVEWEVDTREVASDIISGLAKAVARFLVDFHTVPTASLTSALFFIRAFLSGMEEILVKKENEGGESE